MRGPERLNARRVWFRGDLRGFYAGFRLADGAVHFGVRLFKDRSRQYGNQRHPEHGVAFWCRRARRDDRGYPYTVTFKVTTALRAK